MTLTLLTKLEQGDPVAIATAFAVLGLLYVIPKVAASGKREAGLPVSMNVM